MLRYLAYTKIINYTTQKQSLNNFFSTETAKIKLNKYIYYFTENKKQIQKGTTLNNEYQN